MSKNNETDIKMSKYLEKNERLKNMRDELKEDNQKVRIYSFFLLIKKKIIKNIKSLEIKKKVICEVNIQ